MESIKGTGSKNTYTFNKCTNSQSSIHASVNSHSLYDPYDLNHIHGLRK